MQKVTNPPRCPLDRTEVIDDPVNLALVDNERGLDGSYFKYPVLRCPTCGLLFCIDNT